MSYEFLLNIDVRFELIKMQMLYIVSGLNISFRIKPSSCLQICQFVLCGFAFYILQNHETRFGYETFEVAFTT